MHPILREELGIPEGEIVIAGMSLGWADIKLPENRMGLDKLGGDDFAIFIDE
jgi:nitrobenzene nitroreductase